MEGKSVRAGKAKRVAKVPVIQQMEALECGAASLAMILAHYGRWVTLEQARVDCGVSRDGSKASQIFKAAQNYGLEARAFRFDPQALRQHVSCPAILHWNFNHFVVLCGFGRKGAVINDPASGRRTVPDAEFDRCFTGICMEFDPGPRFAPGGHRRSVLAFVRERLTGYGRTLAFLMLACLLTAATGVLAPAFTKFFTDSLLPDQNPDWRPAFFAAMAALILFTFAANSIQNAMSLKLRGKLSVVSNAAFMWHALHLPLPFFSQRMAGEVTSRGQANDTVADTLISKFSPALMNAALLVLYLTVMLHYSVPLALAGVGASVLNFIVSRVIAARQIDLTRAKQRDLGRLSAITASGVDMFETIQAAGAENGYFARWSGIHAAITRSTVSIYRTNSMLGSVPGLVQDITNVFVLTLGVLLIIEGQFTAGALLAFQGFVLKFLTPVNDLLDAGQKTLEMRTDMERIEDVMHYPQDTLFSEGEGQPGAKETQRLRGNIELRDVTFGYSALSPPLFEQFSLSIHAGARVALVGSSGCGKSTLAMLIAGLYQPWSGEILYDGLRGTQIPRDVFTSSVGMVNQDIVLFDDTVSANLKMWDDTIGDEAMMQAARDARIHDTVLQRAGGYHTHLREGGKNFSGGQCQRLEIARTLAIEPSVLLLDEATSALDAKTEFDIIRSINGRGVTCVVVAHRLSTIRDCDEILVLEAGAVVERGTHETLLAKGGYYARLIAAQCNREIYMRDRKRR